MTLCFEVEAAVTVRHGPSRLVLSFATMVSEVQLAILLLSCFKTLHVFALVFLLKNFAFLNLCDLKLIIDCHHRPDYLD